MNWFSVYDLDEGRAVGVILESRDGELIAALEGSDEETHSAHRVIRDIIRRGPVREVVPDGGSRKRIEFAPGEPGYAESVLYTLRPPLAPGPRGTVSRVSTPSDMISKVWNVVNPGSLVPSETSLM